MGDPIKAEKVAAHFATPASPVLMMAPFGARKIPMTPAVNFEHALLTATQTFGNSAPLFLLRSIAIDPVTGKSFVPSEGLTQNPVEGSLATSHGHGGLLFGPGFPPKGLPAAINAGVLPGGAMRCTAQLQAVLLALAERMAQEFWNDPLAFASDFDSASQAAGLRILGEEATGFLAWVKSVPGKLVDAYDWAREKELQAKQWAIGQAIRSGNYIASGEAWEDVKDSTQRAGEYVISGRAQQDIQSGVVSAAEAAKAAIDYVRNIPYEDILDACVEALKEILGDAGCALLGELQAMLSDERSVATQLGEIHGTVKAHATIIAAQTAAAVAADILVTKGAATASSRVGIFIARTGGKIGDFADSVSARVQQAYARRRSGARQNSDPSSSPNGTASQRRTSPSDESEGEEKNDAIEGDANGSSAVVCQSCP
jgi:hypothetical protein